MKSQPGLTSTPATRFAGAAAGMSSRPVSAARAAASPFAMARHPTSGRRSTLAHMDLAAADRSYLWHPFTQQRGWASEQPVIIERGEGTDLIDVDGNRYIDGVSSLWCNVHGHAHPRIDAAVRDQLGKVAHSTMLGLSHRPAIELAQRLVALAPPGLTRVFYSDSGSTATEIAVKMAYQYWRSAARTGAGSSRCGWHTTATRSAPF